MFQEGRRRSKGGGYGLNCGDGIGRGWIFGSIVFKGEECTEADCEGSLFGGESGT